jgi:hypothetical protein
MDRHAEEVAALCEAVLRSPGETDVDTRRAAYDGVGLDGVLETYVRKVHESAYRITDSDVASLKAAGYREDAIFEITLAAAVGAASHRLQAGLRALREAG